MNAIGFASLPLQLGALFHLFAVPAPCAAQAAPRSPRRVKLDAGEMWIRRGLAGATIICRSGCLWLTHDRDGPDVVLQPGDAHRVDAGGRLIAQALLPVELEVVLVEGA